MRADATDNWMVLSNRLLLLQETMVGLSQLPLAEVLQRSAEGVTWVFDGSALHTLAPGDLTPAPLVTRGRARLKALGEVYLAYFAGPPEPLYLALSGVDLNDTQEFRLTALYFEHLLAALSAAGYREELARQARTDWLTGLANRRSLARQLPLTPGTDTVVGLLEAHPGSRTQAELDAAQKGLAATLRGVLQGEQVFRAGAFRVALIVTEAQVRTVEAALAQTKLAQTNLEVSYVWARQAELQRTSLGDLLDTAEGALRELLNDRSPQLRGGPAGGTSLASLEVRSGLEQVRLAVQERLYARPPALPPGVSVQLLLDTPLGFVLSYLGAETPARRSPTLVVTDSTSHPYLHDLLAAEPQGLVVGSPGDAALAAAVERVAHGETFYDGPELEASDLYPREREVWRLVVRGLSNAQIAAQLKIREKTVANYVTNLQDKLFLNNRVELVLFYLGKLERPP